MRAKDLYDLVGHTIITADLAYGREHDNVASGVIAVHEKHVCLYVDDLTFAPFIPGKIAGPPIALSSLNTNDWVANQTRFGKAVGAPTDCVDTTTEELGKLRQSNSTDDQKSAAEFAARLAGGALLCPRILTWAKAQKVSC